MAPMDARATSQEGTGNPPVYETNVPERLDRLPWGRFHWLVIFGLGIAWVLDGLEVTLVGSLSGALVTSSSLQMSASRIGLTASAYLVGAVIGAVLFGWLTDWLGRKKLFTVTVLVYLMATIASGFSWSFWSFMLFRFITGMGIGGEYAAVNATIQELIPASRRGFTDLVINGSYWIGAALGALGAVVVLDPSIIDPEYGWRLAFVIGGVIGFVVLLLRRFIPESPRWLMTHGYPKEAEQVVTGIEERIEKETGKSLPPVPPGGLKLRTDIHSWFLAGIRALFTTYIRRTVLGTVLMAAQAFCYNAVFFTYALVLTDFYHISPGRVGLFMLPFAFSNFLGPLVLGRLFDTVGRRPMLVVTYGLAGVLMAITALLFVYGGLSSVGQTGAWTAIFFVASAAASAAYLVVGESFPLEVRAVAIALFYAFGTGVGGIAGPALFGYLIGTGSRVAVMWGYLLGAAVMIVGAVTAWFLAVNAERRPLEEVAPPLSAVQ
ncbi:MAG: MFS transporter [Pseudomonadota bacterium]|nr:MFS transporter [Pseudomonadota bacterium]